MTSLTLTAQEARVLLDNLAHADASKLPPATWDTYTAAKRKLADIETAGTLDRVRQHLELFAEAAALPSCLERAA